MSRHKVLLPAAQELLQAAEEYEVSSQGLGSEFVIEYQSALDLIVDMPEAWSPVDHQYRKFLLRRFPYVIIYRMDDGLVVVTSIFHQHRRPNSWRQNIEPSRD